MSDEDYIRSGIGHSTPDTITVCGRDLAGELMGTVPFTSLAFLLASGRMPTAGEGRVFDAVLVSLTDHGLTPIVLAARLTQTGAPESLQGAIAAGLLGGGSVFLGPTEDTARFLHAVVAEAGLDGDSGEAELAAAAEGAVRARIDGGDRVPGLGHPIHKELDPRVPRVYEIAREEGTLGPHLRLLEAVRAANEAVSGRRLPINGAGAGGAALADLGLPPDLARGFALLARVAGLIGHLAEERERPIGMKLYGEVDRRMVYEPADRYGDGERDRDADAR
ncbi:MAG: citryl-CoA lyase [Solirubrobacterales bacterium]|nr:citryl-CoA lyase [Solirubrobacterales bacterium]